MRAVLKSFRGRDGRSGPTGNIGIVDHVWSFEFDGSWMFLSVAAPSFTFSVSSSYVVGLAVTDSSGNSDTDTVLVGVIHVGNVWSLDSLVFTVRHPCARRRFPAAAPSIASLPLPELFQVAIKTDAIVTAQCATASLASPFRLLSTEEGFDSFIPYVKEVLDLAHPEVCPVLLVDGSKRLAREAVALVAVLDLVLEQQLTLLLEKRALFVPWPTSDAVHHLDAFALHVMCGREIRRADIAIHAAWRDQLLFHT